MEPMTNYWLYPYNFDSVLNISGIRISYSYLDSDTCIFGATGHGFSGQDMESLW